jgi:hypothetical protein
MGAVGAEPPSVHGARAVQLRAAQLLTLAADAIQLLGRSAWPMVDVIVRVWVAEQAIMSGLIPAYGWNFELTLAMNEYPIPWLEPRIGALLGIVLQVFGGSCVLLAFATRAGAFATLLLNVATPLYYVPLDVDLFRSMFAAGYVLRGPGRCRWIISSSKACRAAPYHSPRG